MFKGGGNMQVIIGIILGAVAYLFSQYIRRGYNVLVVIAMILSGLSLYYQTAAFDLIISGMLGYSFFVVVMFAGAFKKQTKLSKRLRSVRKEYSILGFIFLLPHFLVYLLEFINGEYPWELFGVIGAVIMIPLFITSFGFIKKKMNIKKWKKLQKWAYLVYVLIFIHLIIVASPEHQISYVIIFGLYTVLKFKNYLFQNVSHIVPITVLGILAVVLGYVSLNNLELELNASSVGTNYQQETLVDGTFSGTGSGFKGDTVLLDVIVENGEIKDIIVEDCGCTAPKHGVNFEEAVNDIIEEIITYQTTDLDTISGATISTTGVLQAVDDALNDNE